MATQSPHTRSHIVDAAITLAEAGSWEAVRLYDVAEALGITLDEIRLHFAEKEDVVDAWFDRADSAMLKAAQMPELGRLSPRERVHLLVMAWLDALSAHRKVTRQMIVGKLEPGHLHIQIPGLMRVSRTVQWIREAAHRDATFVHRAIEETALTTIYLMTFAHWMTDESPRSRSTTRFLDRLLALAEAGERFALGIAGRLPRLG
jgi:ubiquinone biosynthesis protein COQ9